MASPPDLHPREVRPDRSAGVAGVVLCAVFLLLTWPVILAGGGGTSEASDQTTYHLPVIRTMAEQWPHVDIVNYRSTTSPGYHLALAVVVRYVTGNVTVLQLISSMASLALLLVVWRIAARPSGGWTALALTAPLLFSTYVVGGAIWLTTDNAAMAFVALALGGAVMGRSGAPATALRALLATIAVFIRQIHLWVAAPIAVAAMIASPAGQRLPPVLRAERSTGWGGLAVGLVALLAPFAVLAWLVAKWGGLTPPEYADIHDTGANPANLVVILSLFSGFGVFFMPAICRSRREWLPFDVAGATVFLVMLVAAFAFATSYDKDAGRWGGAIWELVRRTPTVGERSLVLPPLAAFGAFVLLRAAQAGFAAGRGREVAILLVGLAGWAAAQSVNAQAWQRYCEPMVLILLAWMTALSLSGRRPATRWWVGPALLAGLQLVLLVRGLYLRLES